MTKQFTIQDFYKRFPTDDACIEHLMAIRYGSILTCPKCDKTGKFSKLSGVPAYSCAWCGHHIHPMVGTPFAKSRTSLQKWFYAMYLFTTTRHGVPARELQRQLGVTLKTAWRMGHQIRKYMAKIENDNPTSGIFEIDETMVGGKKPGKRGRGASGKTVVFGILEKAGDIALNVVSDVKRKTLYPIIEENIVKGSTIQSDELHSYSTLQEEGYVHKTVNHGIKEYVKGDIHVNGLEGFWSQLKRSIQGTHIHVSGRHLSKYLGEFKYRYNMRKLPQFMFNQLLLSF